MAVNVQNQLVNVHEPGVSRLVLEVLAHGDQDVVSDVVLALLSDKLHELLDPLLHVVVRGALPVHQRLVITGKIPAEARRRTVLIIENSWNNRIYSLLGNFLLGTCKQR